MEFSFIKESFDAAIDKAKEHDSEIEVADKSTKWNVFVPIEDKERTINRVIQHKKILRNVQILWLDDHPENNLNERKMFRQLNVEIGMAKNTKEALSILKNSQYDIVISDMKRSNQQDVGLSFLNEYRMLNNKTPVIFYVGVIDFKKGVPAKSFGITNRPDELLHLILDALERK